MFQRPGSVLPTHKDKWLRSYTAVNLFIFACVMSNKLSRCQTLIPTVPVCLLLGEQSAAHCLEPLNKTIKMDFFSTTARWHQNPEKEQIKSGSDLNYAEFCSACDLQNDSAFSLKHFHSHAGGLMKWLRVNLADLMTGNDPRLKPLSDTLHVTFM